MKIQSTQINLNKKQSTSFKKGLTSYEINKVKNMKPFEYEDITRDLKNRYNIEAYLGECNTVAWCVKEVVEIMKKAGFKLPSKFSFNYFTDSDALGKYAPKTDTVDINSKYTEFTDLEKQNKLEESQGTFHPKTKHFLQTYLHEFSHAAHFQNLCYRYGYDNAKEMMLGYLNSNENSASVFIREPLNTALKCHFPTLNLLGIIDKVCPPNNGEYAAETLNEYFAEKNSRIIAEQLGSNYIPSNVSSSLASSYTTHPSGWKLKSELGKTIKPRNIFEWMNPVMSASFKVIDKCKEHISYIDGDIYHGNIDYLQKNI